MIKRVVKNVAYALQEIGSVSKSALPLMALLAIFNAISTVLELFLIKFVVNYALSDMFSFGRFFLYLLLYFGVAGSLIVLNKIITAGYINRFEVSLKTYTMSKIYKKASEIDLINFNSTEFYDKLHRAMEESSSRYYMVLMQLFSFVVSSLVFISVFSIYRDFVVILATAINVVLFLIYYYRANKKRHEFEKREERYFRFDDYLSLVFAEEDYAQELRVSVGITDKLLEKHFKISEDYREKYGIYLKAFSRKSVLMTSFSYLLYGIVSIYAAGLLMKTKISIGDFLVLINVVSVMSNRLIEVLRAVPDIYKSSLYIDEIREILDWPCMADACVESAVPEDFESIELQHLFFQYREGDSFELRDINFTIHEKETVAIVGQNGSGKSTVIQCILGLLEPQSGSIRLSGRKYRDYDTKQLRNLFSVVFQDYRIYELSIAENILMREVQSEEDILCVEQALQYVGLDEKVKAMGQGIHTVISCENTNLSVGEKQKIAIARAYARKTPVLIFDEPTAALDVYAANAFYEKLFQMKERQQRTIIFTSHKLRHVIGADKIVYMEDGGISEIGSHEELMQCNKGYAALYKMQES